MPRHFHNETQGEPGTKDHQHHALPPQPRNGTGVAGHQVHGGDLVVNRTGPADTNKKLFEQKHDRQRQAPPANATTSANVTSASAKLASVKAAANATSTRDNAGQKVLLKTGQAAQAAPADECLLKAACLYGVAHRRRDDGKKNEIRASEKECLDELASFLLERLEYAGKTWPGQGQRTKDAVYTGYHSGKPEACKKMYECQTVFNF